MQCRDTKNVRRKQVSLQLKWMKKQDEEAVATAASIAGEEVSIEDFRTQINNDGTIEIDLYTGNASTVVIPDTVKEISYNAFVNCFNLASVQMGEEY